MTARRPRDGDTGPTVILVGGLMTVDDGTALDSRQPIDGDPECRTMRRCLAGSMLWWLTTVSVVNPMLDDAGPDAFALVIGPRTVLELQADGSLRRHRLRSILRGGLSTVELRGPTNQDLNAEYEQANEASDWRRAVWFRQGRPLRPWRILSRESDEWYLPQAGGVLQPTVIVDTGDTAFHGDSPRALRERRLFDKDVVLVMPHTHAAERRLDLCTRWDEKAAMPTRSSNAAPWDPTAPPDPVHYTIPIPIEARFGITGLMQRNEWRDSSDLEAARALLQARFDLRIGIWDLVRHPVLRDSLLEPEPRIPASKTGAPVPAGAARRADRLVAARMEALAGRRDRINSMHAALIGSGWKATDDVFGSGYRVDLTEPVRWPEENRYEPLATLGLRVRSGDASVSVFGRHRTNTGRLLRGHAHELSEVARPGECYLDRAVLWYEQGGWDSDIDWPSRAADLATRIKRWPGLLRPLIDECRAYHQRFVAQSGTAEPGRDDPTS
jgi:hypothetical protein